MFVAINLFFREQITVNVYVNEKLAKTYVLKNDTSNLFGTNRIEFVDLPKNTKIIFPSTNMEKEKFKMCLKNKCRGFGKMFENKSHI